MSLISVFRDDDKIIAISDSGLKEFYSICACYTNRATKILFYENKYIIQNCGLGTLSGKLIEYHILDFAKSHQNLTLNELPSELLSYFKQFSNCGEVKKMGKDSEIIFTISGWDQGKALIYSVNTSSGIITVEEDDVVAYGICTSEYKKAVQNSLKEGMDCFLSLITPYALITSELKAQIIVGNSVPLTLEKIREVFKEHPELKKEHVAIDAPYDYIILNKDGLSEVKIEIDKDTKWLDEDKED